MLVKSSVASIPIYAMQTALLPPKVSQQLDKLIAKSYGET